jgi:hypothetical protein
MPTSWAKPFLGILEAHKGDWEMGGDKVGRSEVVETVANAIRKYVSLTEELTPNNLDDVCYI